MFSSNEHFRVDPAEAERSEYIDTRQCLHLEEESDDLAERLEKYGQIDCSAHYNSEHDRIEARNALLKRFTLFYLDLLQEKHLKVSDLKLGQALLEHIMNSKDHVFKDLRKKIQDSNIDKENAFEELRSLNP